MDPPTILPVLRLFEMLDFLFNPDPSASGLNLDSGLGSQTQFLHGSTNYSTSAPDWHKTDDPWGAYLNSDAGKHVNQGGTQWVDISKGNWQDYNVHGVSTSAASGSQSLNQTPGWGTGSGNSFGDGGAWDSGVGNNTSDQQIYPYNATNHGAQTTGLYGSTNYSTNAPDWHKTDDPWGAYLNSAAGKHVNQGGTQWVDVSKGNWADYNAHGVSTAAAPHAATSLNQTYGWGTESGSSYGDGGGWDSGVGNNTTDQQNYPYNAVAERQLAAPVAAAAAADAASKPAPVSRPSLGHYYVCGTAMLLGALAATQEELGALGQDKKQGWGERFRAHAEAHAAAVSPVGHLVLSRHVFGEEAA
mmetsp:Transcript_17775/g.49189  ORF Transcript_17775/g.49189 Transcript_17775/m.49189 type:complete len:358 (-) Transcript_17775:17-1090(-)